MKELEFGDLVRCYGNPKFDVLNPVPNGDIGAVDWSDEKGVWVSLIDRQMRYAFHRKQLRLITRKKAAPITRKNIEDAWFSWRSDRHARGFEEFIKGLEKIIGREIK